MKPHKFYSFVGRALPRFRSFLQVPKILSLALLALLLVVPGAFAEEPCDCWRNSKTGKSVRSYPYHADEDLTDPNRAFRPSTGDNFYRDKDCTWRNSKTGKSVRSYPYHADEDLTDPNRAFRSSTGDNFYREVPCPPTKTTTSPPPPVEHSSALQPQPFEFALGYSHMKTDGEEVGQLNGFKASGFYNVNPWLAVGGEFSGLYGSRTLFGGDVDVSLDRYLYLFGARVSTPIAAPVGLYGQVLVGGVHDRSDVKFPRGSSSSSANAFAMAIGVGIDFPITKWLSVGPSIEYVPTFFSGGNGNDRQDNLRVSLTAQLFREATRHAGNDPGRGGFNAGRWFTEPLSH